MNHEDMKNLYDSMRTFLEAQCIGCDKCHSTEELCNQVVNLKIMIGQRMKEAKLKEGVTIE